MTEEFAYELEEFLDSMGIVMLGNSLSSLFGLVSYVLSSLAIYTIASRRGINHAWLAWVPLANLWILGSLSDQYRYVSRGEVKNKRKALLTLSIIEIVLGVIAAVVVTGAVIVGVSSLSEDAMLEAFFGSLMGLVLLCLPIGGVAIAIAIIRYMALFDVYRSAAPDNAVLFLVLSIFIKITEPFFLFFNREKDTGMVREQPRNAYQVPPYGNQTQGGENRQESQNDQDSQSYQNPQNYQNPQGTPEPWTEKPEHQDPWDQGPEQL